MRMDAMPDGCRGRLTLPAEKASYAHWGFEFRLDISRTLVYSMPVQNKSSYG